MLDSDGQLLGNLNSVYGRIHRLVHGMDTEVDWIVMCEDRLLVSGETGAPLRRLRTPVPAGACFDQSERPQGHRDRGEFHLLGRVGNLFGEAGQDLLLSTNPGGVIWLYRNVGGASYKSPLGTGVNATLY